MLNIHNCSLTHRTPEAVQVWRMTQEEMDRQVKAMLPWGTPDGKHVHIYESPYGTTIIRAPAPVEINKKKMMAKLQARSVQATTAKI